MKFQFTTKSILLATAFLEVAIGGFAPILRFHKLLSDLGADPAPLWADDWRVCLFYTPVFLPLVFGAYSIGRRRLTWKTVSVFSIAILVFSAIAWHLRIREFP